MAHGLAIRSPRSTSASPPRTRVPDLVSVTLDDLSPRPSTRLRPRTPVLARLLHDADLRARASAVLRAAHVDDADSRLPRWTCRTRIGPLRSQASLAPCGSDASSSRHRGIVPRFRTQQTMWSSSSGPPWASARVITRRRACAWACCSSLALADRTVLDVGTDPACSRSRPAGLGRVPGRSIRSRRHRQRARELGAQRSQRPRQVRCRGRI